MTADGWHRVDPLDVPDEGRVCSVVVDGRTDVIPVGIGARDRPGATAGDYRVHGLAVAQVEHEELPDVRVGRCGVGGRRELQMRDGARQSSMTPS